jgi:hypothetical protein
LEELLFEHLATKPGAELPLADDARIVAEQRHRFVISYRRSLFARPSSFIS